MRRRNSFLLCVVGVLMLVYGIWSLYTGLFDRKIERIETFQAFDIISAMESYGKPVYVHANEGVGPTAGRYDLAVLVEYKRVNGTLQIDHYYSDFGEVAYQPTHKLDGRSVTGNGSTTFVTTHNYVGVNLLVFKPDHKPSPAIEIWIYTINYELRPQRETVLFGLTSSLIGTIPIATMLATVAHEKEEV